MRNTNFGSGGLPEAQWGRIYVAYATCQGLTQYGITRVHETRENNTHNLGTDRELGKGWPSKDIEYML